MFQQFFVKQFKLIMFHSCSKYSVGKALFVCQKCGHKLSEPRINFKYLVKLEKSATDIYKMLQAYAEGTM
jgi:hypothetical protein